MDYKTKVITVLLMIWFILVSYGALLAIIFENNKHVESFTYRPGELIEDGGRSVKTVSLIVVGKTYYEDGE